MQIVIDIPKYVIDDLKECGFIPEEDNEELCKAIDNGTVLPEYGRLIDADAFIKEKTKIFCENCNRRRGMKDGKLTKHFVYNIGDVPCRACYTGDMIDYVDDAPTILEGTKGQKSEDDN